MFHYFIIDYYVCSIFFFNTIFFIFKRKKLLNYNKKSFYLRSQINSNTHYVYVYLA